MAYQDIKAGIVVPPITYAEDPAKALESLRLAHNQVTQEVRECHKRIQQFTITIAAATTTLAVTLAIPAFTANYAVAVDFDFNNGGHWQTAKTTTGFTLTWATASPGAPPQRTARCFVIE